LQASNAAIGFRNTLRWSGGICFIFCCSASLAMKWDHTTATRLAVEREQAQQNLSELFKVPLVNWRVAKTRRFVASALGAALQSAAYYTPIFFFAAYAETLGYSDQTSTNFIAINNACNAVGKIVIGHAADRVGRLNALFLSTFISAAAAFAFVCADLMHTTP
jgi:cyanate permease